MERHAPVVRKGRADPAVTAIDRFDQLGVPGGDARDASGRLAAVRHDRLEHTGCQRTPSSDASGTNASTRAGISFRGIADISRHSKQIVRDAVVTAGGPADWALPYWNYSDSTQPNARTMPDAFDLPTLPDGSDNPLRVERRFGDGTTPIQLDPAFVSLAALQDDAFPGGDSDIPPGFGGPETVFHHGPESDTTNGGLESLPHNVIHGAIGGVAPGGDPNDWRNLGLMSMPITAALDPIFWLHHANIDRLWSVWLRDSAGTACQPRPRRPGSTDRQTASS